MTKDDEKDNRVTIKAETSKMDISNAMVVEKRAVEITAEGDVKTLIKHAKDAIKDL